MDNGNSNMIEYLLLKDIEYDVDTAKTHLNNHVTTEGKILNLDKIVNIVRFTLKKKLLTLIFTRCHNNINIIIVIVLPLAIATLYDKDGNVIAIARALAEPVNIAPNSQAAFGLAATQKLQTYKVKSYSLIGDSDQYMSLPVFVSK
jgi:hypothetical protein